MTLSSAQQEQIVSRIRELGATLPCPRCSTMSFTLVQELNAAGGLTMLPTVILMCNQCGFLSPHALAALGLEQQLLAGHTT